MTVVVVVVVAVAMVRNLIFDFDAGQGGSLMAKDNEV